MVETNTLSRLKSEYKEDAATYAKVLLEVGVISGDDAQLIENQATVTAARIQATKGKDKGPADPLEVIQHLKIKHAETGVPLDAGTMMEAVAGFLEVPFERIDPLKLDADFVTGLFSRPFANRHSIIPIREEENKIIVASSRPFDAEGIEIAHKTARAPIQLVLAVPNEVRQVIRELYGFRTSVKKAERVIGTPTYDLQNFEQLVRVRGERELEASDQHIVNAVDYLLRYAFDLQASDIHIEPHRKESQIRMRIDGVMHKIYSMPRHIHLAMISRIKTLARMDIAEKRRPQDGRIKSVNEDREIEMRVSSLPVGFGEKIVIRIFDPTTVSGDLTQLGFRTNERTLFEKWIRQPHGVILITGPTGSGKSTTLYTALQSIANDQINIVTIEDPIEMLFDHLNQVAVQPQVGITFASALRTILRQDPDVIMVGEIRDSDTAQNAIQAALTGHMVFSTLHTNDAPTAIPRLNDLDVEPFLLSSALTGIMAQRLVRKICPKCSIEEIVPAEEILSLGGKVADNAQEVTIAHGEGCAFCRGTGYKGRIALFEMMEIDNDIRVLIESEQDAEKIRTAALKKGMRSLREAGLNLVMEGITTREEVIRVTSDMV